MLPELRTLILASVISWAGCSRGPEAGKRESGKASAGIVEGGSFRLAKAEARRIERAIVTSGSLLPLDQTPVAVKVPGRLGSIAVDLGSRIREGDLVARVDPVDYELRLKQSEAALGQARARVGLPLEGEDDRVAVEDSPSVKEARAVLDEARANRDRILALQKQGILSASELETASATFKVAVSRHDEALEEARIRVAQLQQKRAEFEMARQQLSDTYIVAPFDGAVQERRASVGEYLAVGAPVVVLVRTEPLRLRVEVSERDAVRVRTGQPVRVSVEGDTNLYSGEVRRLSPAIVQGSRTLVVEADVPSQGVLRPGSFARVQIVTVPEIEAVTVPTESVVMFAGIEKVFTVADGIASEKRITTGDRGQGWIEVLAGLRPGETVVLAPGGLQAGQRVTPATGVALPTAGPEGADKAKPRTAGS